MFAELDETIRRLLAERGHLNSGEVDIAFDMPTRDWAAGISKPTVNLYMYDIRENLELKDPSAWVVRRGPDNTAIKSKPDVRVDLTYNITAFANSIEDEHRLLSRIMLTLLQHPAIPEDLMDDAIAGQEILASTAQSNGIFQSPSDYWGVIDNDIRPSIDYKVTMRLDLNQEVSVGLALTSQFGIGQYDSNNGHYAEKKEELPYQVGGRIHEEGDLEAGIPNLTVTLLERALDTTTDERGHYSFRGVPAGQYTLLIYGDDFNLRREQIEVPSSSYDIGL